MSHGVAQPGSSSARGGDLMAVAPTPCSVDSQAERRWIFICKQTRLSEEQMGIYSSHVEAAEAVDEDFGGNFS